MPRSIRNPTPHLPPPCPGRRLVRPVRLPRGAPTAFAATTADPRGSTAGRRLPRPLRRRLAAPGHRRLRGRLGRHDRRLARAHRGAGRADPGRQPVRRRPEVIRTARALLEQTDDLDDPTARQLERSISAPPRPPAPSPTSSRPAPTPRPSSRPSRTASSTSSTTPSGPTSRSPPTPSTASSSSRDDLDERRLVWEARRPSASPSATACSASATCATASPASSASTTSSPSRSPTTA